MATNEEDSKTTIEVAITTREILEVEGASMNGYVRLEDQERTFRWQTFKEHEAVVSVWIRLLDLYEAAIQFSHDGESLEDALSESEKRAMELQYRFFALAGGTAKLAFDAACAAYYAQAFMLFRHLLETWVVLMALRVRPDQSERWFQTQTGSSVPAPPKDTTMHAWIRGSETGKKNAELLNQVLANIKRNDDMAHPGAKTLFQTLSMLPNSIQIGGNYVTSSTKGVLTEGAAAFRILLDLWNRIVPQDQLWLAEMEEVRTLLRESVEESQRG